MWWALAAAVAWGGDGPEAVLRQPPELVSSSAPTYPASARGLYVGEVSCRVRVGVDAEGAPRSVDPVDCNQAFFPATRDAVMAWRWNPAREEGEPVPARVLLAISYKLPGEVDKVVDAEAFEASWALHTVDEELGSPGVCWLAVDVSGGHVASVRTNALPHCMLVSPGEVSAPAASGRCSLKMTVSQGSARDLADLDCGKDEALAEATRQFVQASRWAGEGARAYQLAVEWTAGE